MKNRIPFLLLAVFCISIFDLKISHERKLVASSSYCPPKSAFNPLFPKQFKELELQNQQQPRRKPEYIEIIG